MSQKREGGCHTPYFPFVPVDIGVFRPRPARPIRASGKGDDGSDPRRSPPRRRQGRVRLDVARPCVQRPIPWPCSSAFTRRTFTAPASRGTTSRPAGPCSSPGNSSSAHHGVGSPGWASVWGAGSNVPQQRAGTTCRVVLLVLYYLYVRTVTCFSGKFAVKVTCFSGKSSRESDPFQRGKLSGPTSVVDTAISTATGLEPACEA